MRKTIPILILTFLFCSCEKEKESLIHPEFRPYVDRFYDEAESRGITLPEDLEVVFSDVFPSGFCGYGYSSVHPRLVRIRNTESCWIGRTDIERENLVFHELGHALLNRSHTNKSFSGGYTASIMCTSEGDAFCNGFQVFYNDEMRSYFLDELFSASTPPPRWSSNEINLGTVFTDSISALNDWEFFDTDDERDDYNFYIDEEHFNGSKSLVIEKSTNNANQVYGYFVKRFKIESFPTCSSLKAKAKIKSLGGFYGYVGIGISLREADFNGELHRFAYHEFRETKSQFTNGGAIETELFCIPDKTEIVSISITFNSSIKSKIFIDDVVVELWD